MLIALLTLRLGLASPSFIQIDVPEVCSCDCCNVVARRPNEIAFGVNLTCAPTSVKDTCGQECSAPEGDSVLVAAGETVDQIRFCFFECKPTSLKAKLESQCQPLAPEDIKKVRDKSGNSLDPAVIFVAPPPEAADAHGPISFLQRRVPEGTDVVQGADAMADEVKAQRAVTQGTVDTLRGQEAAAVEAAANAPDELEAIRKIQQAERDAAAAAVKAGEESGEAAKAAVDARKAALEGAMASGKQAMEEVKAADIKSAEDLAKFRERFVNKGELKAMAAAAEAAAPYHLAMTRAQKTVRDFYSQAESDAANAKNMQAAAMKLASDANTESDSAKALNMYNEAKVKATEADEYASTSKQNFATADHMNLEMPKYQAAAQAAAARAAYDAMPAWHPPPPPAGVR